MGKKATRAEAEARTSTVLKMLASGYQRPAIIQFANEEWGLGVASADLYIRKAKDQIIELIDEDRRQFMARKLYQLEEVLLRSSKRENHSAMIGAIRLQCELTQILSRFRPRSAG